MGFLEDDLDWAAKQEGTLRAIREEWERARQKFPRFNSPHEGYAVIKEELEELWDAVKADDYPQGYKEALQIAAMAFSYLMEISPTKPRP